MNGKREKVNEKLKSYAKLLELVYNEAAASLKQSDVRLKIANGGVAASTARGFDKGSLVALFNSDTAVHFYATGGSAMGAPSGATNGIPVFPGSLIVVPLGDDTYIRSDSALVFVYAVDEDSYVQ